MSLLKSIENCAKSIKSTGGRLVDPVDI